MKITKKNTKAIAALTALTAILGLSLSACGSSANGATQDDKVIKVAASPTPHSDILNKVVKPILQKQGYKLVVKEFTDYVQPNTAVEEGEVDANYHQHLPYLNNFNKERGTHIISIAGIHFEPFGLYPGKTKSIKDLKDGATVAIPSDPTNEARALLLLQDAGLLKLKNPKDVNSTKKDIISNPKNLKFKELDASLVPTVVKDVDLAALNGNYAIQAGFNPTKDPLTSEKVGGVAAKTYENIIAVKKGSEKLAKIKALVKALKTSKVRDFIKKNYNGAVLPVF